MKEKKIKRNPQIPPMNGGKGVDVSKTLFYPFWDEGCGKKVRTVKIKKVDDKPMVIHTKKKKPRFIRTIQRLQR